MSAKDKETVTPKVRATAELIKAGMTLGPNGVVTQEKGIFKNYLPENDPLVNEKTIKAIDDFRNNVYVPAHALALGEVAKEAFEADSSLKTVQAKADFGTGFNRHDIVQTIFREKEIRIPGPDSKTRTNHLHLESRVKVIGATQLGHVKAELLAIGEELYG
jgi:hypothetical protein